MDNHYLRADPNPKERGSGLDGGTHVRVSRSEPGGALSLSAGAARTGTGHALGRYDPANRAGVSQLRLATHDGGAAATGGERRDFFSDAARIGRPQ